MATTCSARIASIALIGARLYALPVRALDGKTALVTGAAGAIGGAVVRAFEAAGAEVLAVDRVRAPVGDPYLADLTESDAVEGAVAAALERHGRLDVVFNGAGISGRALGDGPVETCSLEAWDAVLETNLKSVFLCCKHAIPALRRSGGGAIINLGSVLGLVGAEDFQTHAYAASKGGIIALTRAVAIGYARERIRCNAICPGLIETPMSERARNDPQVRGRLAELQPLTGAPGAPEDVAQAAAYLASAQFVTGAVLPVDGGWTAQ
jgi:NAD(P)-dependent dehydrogenase (short-subunit alcohol dehydrogenase family)